VKKQNGEIYCQTGMRLTDKELCLDSPCCHWNTKEPGDASFNGAGRCWSSIGQEICSTPALAQIGHGLRRDKMRDQVWKQRNERDSKVVASEAKVKAASTKKQKTAEPIAKQKVAAASGEAVMLQAAQTMSRSSNELRRLS